MMMNRPLQKTIAGAAASLLLLLLSLALIRPNLGLSSHSGTDLGLGKAQMKSSSGHHHRRQHAAKSQEATTIRRWGKKEASKMKSAETVPELEDDHDYVTDKSNPLESALDAHHSYQTGQEEQGGGGQKQHPRHHRLPPAAAPVPPTFESKQALLAGSRNLQQPLDAADAWMAKMNRGARAARQKIEAAAAPAGAWVGAPSAAAAPAAAPSTGEVSSAAAPSAAPAAAPAAAKATAPPKHLTTHNDTNTTNTTKPCLTRLEARAAAAWTLFVSLSPPDTPCVFGVDPRDEGEHCIEEKGDLYGSYGWCYTAEDGSSWGSCNQDCPLYGHMGILGDKVDGLEDSADDIVDLIENGALNETETGDEAEMPLAGAPMFAPLAGAPDSGPLDSGGLAGAPAANSGGTGALAAAPAAAY